jgi:hypothetical protein
VVTETDQHELYQRNAPQVMAGLYLVPEGDRVSACMHSETVAALIAGLRARKFSASS